MSKFQNRDEEYDKVEETLILEVLAGGGKVCVGNSYYGLDGGIHNQYA